MNGENKHFYEFGPFRLDAEKIVLWHGDKLVPLQPKALETLVALVKRHGDVVSKDELLAEVWSDTFVEENNLSRNVHDLRKILSGLDSSQAFIETVPRRGYRFSGEVSEFDDPELVIERQVFEQTLIEEVSNEKKADGFAEISQRSPSRSNRKWPGKPALFFIAAIGLTIVGLVVLSNFSLRSWNASSNAETKPVHSIAILPLQTDSSTEGDKTLGFGISESLTTRLGGLSQLVVRQVRADGNQTENTDDPLKLGQQLNVDAVLTGSLQRRGGKVRLNLRLLEVNSGRQLWAGSFDEAETEIFKLEDAISTQVTNSLALNLNEYERERLSKRYTENAEAYEAYLRGRYLYHKRNEDVDNYRKSLAEFEHAISLDPNYALAYTGLADAHARRANVSTGAHRIELYEKAKLASLKALMLDENLAEAHASLGWLRRIYDWDWQDSEKHLKKAIELAPNNADHHRLYTSLLITLGRTAEAVEEAVKARDLDPVVQGATLAFALLSNRQYDEAIKEYAKALELNPNASDRWRGLAGTYLGKGMYAETIELVNQAPEDHKNDFSLQVNLASAYFHLGDEKKAKEMLRDLESQTGNNPEKGVRLAGLYSDMGRKDEAIALLQMGLENRDDRLMWIKVGAGYDSLREDPRFQEILRKMNLE